MRRGEVLSLRWAEVDLEAGTVTVSGTYRYAGIVNGKALWKREEPKTPQSRRTLYLTPLGRTALRVQKAQATSAKIVFARANGEPLAADWVTKVFQAELVARGFPKVRFHSLRHSAAVGMLDTLGGDVVAVSKTLGHASLAITADIYGSEAQEARKRAAAAMAKMTEGMA